jgi:hypothetical protein
VVHKGESKVNAPLNREHIPSNYIAIANELDVLQDEHEQEAGLHTIEAHASSTLGPLPAGWEQQTSPTGQPCFVNYDMRLTSWVDPRLQQSSSSSSQASIRNEGTVPVDDEDVGVDDGVIELPGVLGSDPAEYWSSVLNEVLGIVSGAKHTLY